MIHQIDLKYACFGIITDNGIVVETAPIGRWMLGKSFEEIKYFVRKKKGQIKNDLQA